MEPEEIVKWEWFIMNDLPENLYSASKKLLNNVVERKIYSLDR